MIIETRGNWTISDISNVPECTTNYPVILKYGRVTVDSFKTISEAQREIDYWDRRMLAHVAGLGYDMPGSFIRKLIAEMDRLSPGGHFAINGIEQG
jgi:hypothetical protein